MSNMLELSVNLGYDAAVKVTVSNEELARGFFDVAASVSKLHFKVGEPTPHQVLYNAVVTSEVLAKLGNPSEVWVYVE